MWVALAGLTESWARRRSCHFLSQTVHGSMPPSRTPSSLAMATGVGRKAGLVSERVSEVPPSTELWVRVGPFRFFLKSGTPLFGEQTLENPRSGMRKEGEAEHFLPVATHKATRLYPHSTEGDTDELAVHLALGFPAAFYSGSQPGAILCPPPLAPRAHLAISGDIFFIITTGKGVPLASSG